MMLFISICSYVAFRNYLNDMQVLCYLGESMVEL